MITDEDLDTYNSEYLHTLLIRINRILARRNGKTFIIGELKKYDA